MQGDVFKALADETRRAILDALLTTDGQTLTELTGRFPAMTRFGVMKHLAVLEEAGLLTTLKQGRTKRHFLNPVPIAQIADRWISRYAEPFTTALVGLKAGLEEEATMATNHVHQIYIRSDLATVWRAIIDPAFTRQYFFGSSFETPPVAGEPFRSVLPDGSLGSRRRDRAARPAAPAGAHLAGALRRGPGRRARQPGDLDAHRGRRRPGAAARRARRAGRQPADLGQRRVGLALRAGRPEEPVETGAPLPPRYPAPAGR
ncbi:MAG: helix-turn-helix domain-containing protein [Micropruina sp.]